jgi:hypothetical protein
VEVVTAVSGDQRRWEFGGGAGVEHGDLRRGERGGGGGVEQVAFDADGDDGSVPRAMAVAASAVFPNRWDRCGADGVALTAHGTPQAGDVCGLRWP